MEKKRISALLFAFCGFVVHTGVLGTIGQDISPDNSLAGYDDIHYEYIPEILRNKKEDNQECACPDTENEECSFVSGQETCRCKGSLVRDENDKKCKACACPDTENEECSFVSGQATCRCKGSLVRDENDKKCKECACPDAENEECSFVSGQATCRCKGSLVRDENDKKCKECACTDPTKEVCSFVNGEKTCQCKGNLVKDDKDGKCKECICPDARNEVCSFINGEKSCQCKKNFLRDKKDGKCKDCNCGEKGTCSFENGNKKCTCDSGYTVDGGICKEKCETDNDCENGGNCANNKVCRCPKGTSGDKCAKVDGCTDDLINICKEGGAKCEYDSEDPRKASCQCEKENRVFHEGKCIPKWCQDVTCGSDAECEYDDSSNIGTCKCKNAEQYYDYKNDKCQNVDKCKLVFCKENEKCKDGICTKVPCGEGYKNENGECKPNFCSRNPCFDKAKCKETSIPGVVKCVCEGPSSYYDGLSCKNASCLLLGDRQSCKDACPSDMQKIKDNGGCEAKEEKNRCTKDCGLGWCILKGKNEECICNTTFSVKEKGKCALKPSFCVNNLRTGDLTKCSCDGIYKYASNGITCEKKSCADDDVQKECKEKRASKCEDKWKERKTPYKCSCSDYYKPDRNNNDTCTDGCSSFAIKTECSAQGKVCYLNAKAEGTCVCPPPFKNEKPCNTIGEYVYKLQNVPVLKKRYLKSESVIDIVLLTKDILESMNTMYSTLQHAYLFNHRLDKDVIKCDLWLKFDKNASEEIKRLDIQGLSDVKCDNCIKDVVLLPPSLLLKKESIKDVKEEDMDVCSASTILCGPYANCKNNKCSCPEGYQISEYGAKQGTTFTIIRCEDIDECEKGTHSCSDNTTCKNTNGTYYCICKEGYKKKDEKKVSYKYELNKDPCVDLCTPNPCGDNGVCSINEDKMFDCKCKTGYEGTLCDRNDVAYANAKKSTTVVGVVLGVILAICLIAFFLYVRRIRKNSDSEDFSPVPTRQDNAEMTERRPVRGVTNRGYQ